MIADRLAMPVDLAIVDMGEVDRRIARRPFCREPGCFEATGPERCRDQQQREKSRLHPGSGSATAPDHGDITSVMP